MKHIKGQGSEVRPICKYTSLGKQDAEMLFQYQAPRRRTSKVNSPILHFSTNILYYYIIGLIVSDHTEVEVAWV